ncbi:MAG: restriction endonuclease [Planctomycetia bacterium]|nr:restriction endonuclease [Planctomycetia bacterium]
MIACCRPGSRGPAHAKAIRELHGSLVAEGVANGWFVALAGFSNEARLLAEERGITLMDGAELLKGLNDVPKLALLRAFNRAGA